MRVEGFDLGDGMVHVDHPDVGDIDLTWADALDLAAALVVAAARAADQAGAPASAFIETLRAAMRDARAEESGS